MKTTLSNTLIVILSSLIMLLNTNYSFGQCTPYIKVDTSLVNADQTITAGLNLPLWLTSGQTLAADQNVRAISVIEFTENGTALEYSRVVKVTTQQTVPAGKVWKVESIIKVPSTGDYGSMTYSSPGTYTFYVPSCADYICVEVWGGGGGGGGQTSGSGGGGGGGGYGAGCYTVTPGAAYTITVGAGGTTSSSSAGGDGGTSSVGALVSASGGTGGGAGPSGVGGSGGTSSATVVAPGAAGLTGSPSNGCKNVDGGAGGNGGAGGHSSCNTGTAGTAPGGGGSSGTYNGGSYSGGAGAAGKVIITW